MNEQASRRLAAQRGKFTAEDIEGLVSRLEAVKEHLTTMHPLGEMNLLLAVKLATAELDGILFMAEVTRATEERESANDLPDPADPPRSPSGSPESAVVTV